MQRVYLNLCRCEKPAPRLRALGINSYFLPSGLQSGLNLNFTVAGPRGCFFSVSGM